MKYNIKRLFFYCTLSGSLAISIISASCNGADCPLNNNVRAKYSFYNSSTGKPTTISDTLSVSALPKDTTILNRALRTASIKLPLSYAQNEDTLLFKFITK